MRHLSTAIASATLLALACLPLAAADMEVNDLRLSLGVQDNNFNSSDTSYIGQNADENWRGQLQYAYGRLSDNGGLIWGAGLALNHGSWDDGAHEAHVSTPAVDVLLGYGYAFTTNVHMELTPFAGYGRSYYGVDGGDSDKWDNYYEYGIKLGAYAALDKMVFGLEVPFLVGRFAPEYTYEDNGNPSVRIDEKRRCQGFGLLATIGYRF